MITALPTTNTVLLGDLVQISKGSKLLFSGDSLDGMRPRYIQIDDLRNRNDLKYAESLDGTEVVADDLIIVWDGANSGEIAYGLTGLIGSTLARIRPVRPVHTPFLARFLQSQVQVIRDNTTGATIPHVSRQFLERIEIPIPFPDDPRRSLAEQKRIAAILDKADAIRRRRQEAARLADTLIPNLYFELFGDPLANNRKWPTAKVETLCDLVRGSSPRPRSDPSFYGGPVPRLMIEDITRDGKYVTPRIDTLTELGATMSRPVVAGTVVMAVSGNVGLVARVLVDACIHDGFVGFKDLDTKAVRADYFMWTLDLLKASHSKRKAGAIWQNLTTHQVKAMDIPLPPPTLQDRFEKLSKQLVDFAQSYTTRVEEVEGLFNSLVQRAFRGEL